MSERQLSPGGQEQRAVTGIYGHSGYIPERDPRQCNKDDHLQKVGDKGKHSNMTLEENLRQSIKEVCKLNKLQTSVIETLRRPGHGAGGFSVAVAFNVIHFLVLRSKA